MDDHLCFIVTLPKSLPGGLPGPAGGGVKTPPPLFFRGMLLKVVNKGRQMRLGWQCKLLACGWQPVLDLWKAIPTCILRYKMDFQYFACISCQSLERAHIGV